MQLIMKAKSKGTHQKASCLKVQSWGHEQNEDYNTNSPDNKQIRFKD